MLSVALHDEHPARRLPAAARRRPGLPDAGGVRVRPQVRRHGGLQPGRRAAAAAAASWSACSPRDSRASASATPTGTSCSASAGAGSSRRRCAPAPRSCRSRSSAAEEIYPMLGRHQAAGPAAQAAVLPGHADVPVARAARAGAAAEQVADRVLPADPDRAPDRTRPTTRWSCSTSPTRSARRSSRPCTGCWSAARTRSAAAERRPGQPARRRRCSATPAVDRAGDQRRRASASPVRRS